MSDNIQPVEDWVPKPRYETSSPEARAGAWGERVATDLFRSLGYGIIRASDIPGGAAMLERDENPLILPDRLVLQKGGPLRWVEVKVKGGPVLYNISGTLRHGVDIPNWLHYLRIQEETDLEVGLALVQVKDHRASDIIAPRLLFQTATHLLASIADLIDRPVANFHGGVVFWEVDVFQDLGLISDIEPYPADGATSRSLHPWEKPAKDGTLPGPRRQLRLPLWSTR